MWPLTLWTYEGSHIISINQVWIWLDFISLTETNLTFSAYLTTWPQMTFDLGMWSLTSWTYEGSLIVINKSSSVLIRLQLFECGQFYIVSLSYNLTSDNLWPWYVTLDLVNIWGFPCCIYDPSLVEIHQSIWKVTFFHRQQTTEENAIPQSFLLSRWHKKCKFVLDFITILQSVEIRYPLYHFTLGIDDKKHVHHWFKLKQHTVL